MGIKINLMWAAALALVAAPLVGFADAKNVGKKPSNDVGVFGAEFGAGEAPKAGEKEKGKSAEKDKPAAKDAGKDKPAAKPEAGKDKPVAKPDAKAGDKVAFEPPPPKPDEAAVAKARKAKKPYYMRFREAKETAWKCQQPLIVAMLPMGDQASQMLEAKALKDKYFAKDFVSGNCVLLIWRLKPGKIEMPPDGRRSNRPPRATTIDIRPFKGPETKFLTAFAVTDQARANAKRGGKDAPSFADMNNYPAIFCVDPACSKLLFRAPRFEADKGKAGFGAWISQIIDLMKGAQFEPVLTPMLEKIAENPTEPKKWK